MSKFNNALFQYYRSLPFGQLVNWQDLKFLHVVNQMIFHFHQKNGLCSKISFFKNNELKTEVFKKKIFALLYRLSQVKERNEPFPLIDTITQKLHNILILVREGENLRSKDYILYFSALRNKLSLNKTYPICNCNFNSQ